MKKREINAILDHVKTQDRRLIELLDENRHLRLENNRYQDRIVSLEGYVTKATEERNRLNEINANLGSYNAKLQGDLTKAKALISKHYATIKKLRAKI